MKGVLIIKVEKGLLVEVCGLKKGDLIIGINCYCVENVSELCKVLSEKLLVVYLNIVCDGVNFFLMV